jgi:hypothetical protein
MKVVGADISAWSESKKSSAVHGISHPWDLEKGYRGWGKV